jgi:1,4-dihydroxy-2-naphthoyl-CoA synthase
MSTNSVITARDGKVLTVTIDRLEVRNAVDSSTADALAHAFKEFEADDELCAAVLTGPEELSALEPICAKLPTAAEWRLMKTALGPWGQHGCS